MIENSLSANIRALPIERKINTPDEGKYLLICSRNSKISYIIRLKN